jgi:putative transposase
MKVLFVFIVLEHRRCEVLHFNVNEHPTAAWTSQQIVEAFAERDAPRYLIRDRDGIYGDDVRLRIASLHMEEVLTAPRSPWQKDYVSHCTSLVRFDVTGAYRRRWHSFPCGPGIFRGGCGPGWSYRHSPLSLYT